MSEPLDWNALTAAQRNALIAERVMGWTSQLCDKSEPLIYYDSGDAECPRCGAYGFGTSFEHGIIPPPRYSESMDAAWLVIKKIASRYYENAEYLDEVFWKFRQELLNDSGDEIYTATDLLLDMAKWTPDAICLIALKAYGVEMKDK